MMGMMNCTQSHQLLRELKTSQSTAEANASYWKSHSDTVLHNLEQQRLKLISRLEAISARGGSSQSAMFEQVHLQGQLSQIDQNIRRMSVEKFAKEDQAHFGSESDQFSRFFFAVGEALRNCPRRRCRLSELLGFDSKLDKQWNELRRSRIIRKSTQIKEVLLEKDKKKEFEIIRDEEGKEVVRFAGENDVAYVPPVASALAPNSLPMPVPMSMASTALALTSAQQQMGMANAAIANQIASQIANHQANGLMHLANAIVPAAASQAYIHPGTADVVDQGVLNKEEISAVEAELAKSGGCERLRKICLHLNVSEKKLSRHFKVFQDNGKQLVSHLIPEVMELESTLLNLSPRRAAIFEAMTFCLENATPSIRASALAKALVRSLHVPDLESESIIARLFLVSDVLFNVRPGMKGTGTYRMVFEESLPDACEYLGRQWLRGEDCDQATRSRGESVVKRMFVAWRTWDVFPAVFVGGLEALLLGPSPEDESDNVDAVLRQKLAEWSSGPAADVPMAARRRGLCGKTLAVAICRQRLCIYERYWHGVSLESERDRIAAREAEKQRRDAMQDDDDDAMQDDGDAKSIDGELLNDEDLELLNGDALSDGDVDAYMEDENELEPVLGIGSAPGSRPKPVSAFRTDAYTEGVQDSSDGVGKEIEALD